MPKKIKFHKINLLDQKKLNQIFKKNKINCVIHLVAKTSVRESQEKPEFYLKTNINSTINLLSSMIQNNCKKIIFSSTVAVYKEKKWDL